MGEENYWLQNLRNDLKAGTEIRSLLKNYEGKECEPYHQAVMDLIVRANREQIEEERAMCEALKELYMDLYADEWKEAQEKAHESGVEQGIRQGLEQGEYRTKNIFKLYASGTPVELIAKKCGVTVEKVQQILE